MRWILIAVAALVALVVATWVVGSMLPEAHVASRSARYGKPPEAVWAALVAVEDMPAWRTGLKSVTRRPDVDGRPSWVETSSQGTLPIVVVEWDPPRRMVGKIDDPALPFGGTWTWEVVPAEGGSTLRITERGEVHPAIFRFLSRFVFGHAGTIETYLKDLGRKFGETATPEP